MNNIKKILMMTLIIMLIGITACDNDDKDEENFVEQSLKSRKKEEDKKNLDEILAQVKNSISDFSVTDKEFHLGEENSDATYLYISKEKTVKFDKNGTKEFADYLIKVLDIATSVSEEDSKKDAVKITLKKVSNGGYTVFTEYVKSSEKLE